MCTTEEIKKYHELGLGRGVNITDPEMWKNKSSFVVRETSYLNLITTDECGTKQAYTKEVSSFKAQQQKVQLSLDEPSSQVKIGMDAQHSRSESSSTLISGERVATKTVSFKSDFSDMPLYTSLDTVSLKMPPNLDSPEREFEKSLSHWILQRISYRHPHSPPGGSTSGDPKEPIEGLVRKLKQMRLNAEIDHKQVLNIYYEIVHDCSEFLVSLGITHYVNSIKLGAMRYRTLSINSKQRIGKGGIEAGAGKVAKGSASGFFAREWFNKEENIQEIGQMREVDKDHTVKVPLTEAVIGFQIQPIHNLVRVQFIRMAMKQAIREYIQHKASEYEGPFLISCKVGEEQVYWKAHVSNKNYQVMGTKSKQLASLFYIKPAEDPSRPCDFFIMYYGQQNDRKILMQVNDFFVKELMTETPLPYYVSTNTTIWGSSDKPLMLKMSVETSGAQFSLHDRVQSSFACLMCRSTPVSMSSWLEGEQFYIKCSQHALKMDGYIAMANNEVKGKSTTTTTDMQTGTKDVEDMQTGTKGVEDKSTTTTTTATQTDTKYVEDNPGTDDHTHEPNEVKGKSTTTTTTATQTDTKDVHEPGLDTFELVPRQKRLRMDTEEPKPTGEQAADLEYIPEYKTVTQLTIQDSNDHKFGMLFRLHPKEYREKGSTGEQKEHTRQPN